MRGCAPTGQLTILSSNSAALGPPRLGHAGYQVQLNGPAGSSIPLSFNGNYAALCEVDASGACEVASVVAWNPVTTPTFRDQPTRYKPGRKVYAYDEYQVYLGGVASPAAAQRQGTYTASIGVLLVVN